MAIKYSEIGPTDSLAISMMQDQNDGSHKVTYNVGEGLLTSLLSFLSGINRGSRDTYLYDALVSWGRDNVANMWGSVVNM